MPPKKKAAGAADGDVGSDEGVWKWTAENDRTLFLMMLGRGALGRSDYSQIAKALSSKTNWNAVRQRVGKFRQEQKKKYEELGWDLPNTPAAKSKAAPVTPMKRLTSDGESSEETPTKAAKKPRTKKTSKVQEEVQNDDEEMADFKGVEEYVKEEDEDELV